MTQRALTALAFAVGFAVSAAGYFFTINESFEASTIVTIIGETFAVFFLPGLFVGLLAGRNVHDPNLIIALIANSLLYGLTLRLIFKKLWKAA